MLLLLLLQLEELIRLRADLIFRHLQYRHHIELVEPGCRFDLQRLWHTRRAWRQPHTPERYPARAKLRTLAR